MVTIKIKKFQLDRSYYSPKSNSPIFRLKARNGKELTFAVIQGDAPFAEVKSTVKVIATDSVAQETTRVSCASGYFDLSASVVLPVGKKFSELPAERQKLIDAVIQKDVEVRKERDLNRASVTTSYTVDAEGNINYDA